MIKRSELLLLLDDRTNKTGLELPAISHFLVMYGLCSYSGLYIKILLMSAIVRTAGCESIFSKYFLSLTLRECLFTRRKDPPVKKCEKYKKVPVLSREHSCFEGQTQYDTCGIELRTHDRQ